MLITLCYSVLTWMQSRQRTEIIKWVEECLLPKDKKCSLVFIRDRMLFASFGGTLTPSHSSCTLVDDLSLCSSTTAYFSATGVPTYGGYGGASRSDSFFSTFSSSSCNNSGETSRNISRSSSTTNSNFSTPSKGQLVRDPCNLSGSGTWGYESLLMGTKGIRKSQSFTGSVRQISELCYNHNSIKLRRLLWEEDRTRAIVLMPIQIVELHDWTSFGGIKITEGDTPEEETNRKFYILLEAEPGLVQRHHYRKFTQFGEIIAWRCGGELALILQSDLNQLIELMHIFRLGQIILDGGWRVYRLTTINCEGKIGTVISGVEIPVSKSLTPADLRRLSAGIHDTRESQSQPNSVTSTPKNSLSKDTSKHDITTISEETIEELETVKRLPNWYERSPRKRSVATLPSFEKASQGRRRVSSFCPGSLSNVKSSSLASFCVKSMSVEEEDVEDNLKVDELVKCEEGRRLVPPPKTLITSSGSLSSKSHESLLQTSRSTSSTTNTPTKLLSPMSAIGGKSVGGVPSGLGQSRSASSSPRKSMKRSPNKRVGKPPNILILCDEQKKREEIGNLLKNMLANDRYAIYDIRWDQLTVGGWSEQTALLVLAGKIPSSVQTSRVLQFLGDGGRLLAWCCQDPPFGPAEPTKTLGESQKTKRIVQYGPSGRITRPLMLCEKLWGVAPGDNQPPPGFQKILGTNDSEGYSRPLTVSTFGKVKGTNETVIVQLDGGALGGKGILSQVEFEKCLEEDDSLALLSLLLSQYLGIDCTQIKSPEYTIGYLLGDHVKVMDFLSSTPSTVQQSELTIEFTPRGEKGSLPSHLRFPVHSWACPQNFSTLEYYNNLETKELGRIVIYTDTITSTSHVLNGHSLRHGIVIIANRQTAGRGRGRNVWLSPEGCAVFSLQLFIDMSSQMGRRISLLQHLAALSVILAVPNHKEINLRVKWPNDIYINEQKVGGILVESRLEGKTAVVNIGIGVNVSNAHPTVCLNSILYPDFVQESAPATKSSKKTKPYLTCEKVIAKTLTELEKLLESIEKDPLENILKLYQQNWIHGDVENLSENEEEDASFVNVEISDGNFAECQITGIDEFGFLRVTELSSGNVFSVRPDGNSFDIANRLIAIKE